MRDASPHNPEHQVQSTKRNDMIQPPNQAARSIPSPPISKLREKEKAPPARSPSPNLSPTAKTIGHFPLPKYTHLRAQPESYITAYYFSLLPELNSTLYSTYICTLLAASRYMHILYIHIPPSTFSRNIACLPLYTHIQMS